MLQSLNQQRHTTMETYETENESIVTDKEKILVLGSGPIRIGQG